MKDLKVILANPPWVEGAVRAGSRWPAKPGIPVDQMLIRHVTFPFYLSYAIALLERMCEVHVYDCLALNMKHEEFLHECETLQPDVVVLETSSVSFSNDMRVCQSIKERCDAKIVLTGPHVTIFYKEILHEHPYVDFIILGEYEFPVYRLVQTLQAGKKLYIKGIAYRKGKRIISTKPYLVQKHRFASIPCVAPLSHTSL